MLGKSAYALECAPVQAERKVTQSLSEGQLLQALTKANLEVEDWLIQKSKSLKTSGRNDVLYGPNLDGTYFYRLGKIEAVSPSEAHKTSDRFSMGQAILKQREKMIAQNFPIYKPTEAASIGFVNNRARAKATSSSIRCMKHFPGGDEYLEMTEAQRVLYKDAESFKKMLEPFVSILRTTDAPTCMMIGHAQYLPEFLGQNSMQNLGEFGFVPFAEIPATLNPGVVQYLRKNLNFDGIVVADWMNMGAISQFVKQLNLPYDMDFVIAYLAVNSGLDFISIEHSSAINISFARNREHAKMIPLQLLEDFNNKLNFSVKETLRRIGIPKSEKFIQQLTLAEKIAIKATSTDLPIGISERYPDIFEKLRIHHLGSDIWNRTGVMTLLQRQIAIESILSKWESKNVTFGRPTTIESETPWFERLMENNQFRDVYDRIDWNSNEVQNLFCHIRKQNFKL